MKGNDLIYVNEYEVNCYTMAILPYMVGGELFSRILEVDNEFVVTMKPIEIVDRSCRYFGSSLKGRRDGTKELMGVTHKAPIIVEASNKIYLFPTASPIKSQCAWLSHTFILDNTYSGQNITTVVFVTKKSIQLQVSKGSFENQLYRTAQLRTVMTTRMEEKGRKMNLLLMPPPQKEGLIYPRTT